MDSTAAVIVFTTLPQTADADAFAHAIVDARLAACVTVSAEMRSTYRWEGAIATDAERHVTIKTTRARLDELFQAVTAMHPYAVPEWLVVDVAGGSPAYLAWLYQSASA